jgi:hypothetical protein
MTVKEGLAQPRQQRLEALARWWKELNKDDLERLARKPELLDGVLNDFEEEWYGHLTKFSEALLFLESKRRWGTSDSTSLDYARTVISGYDRMLRGLAKLPLETGPQGTGDRQESRSS